MKLSISNIAWGSESDALVYDKLKSVGFQGLEMAPTRIWANQPYEHIEEARDWAIQMEENYGLIISSMQSIWYGREERIFGDEYDRKVLMDYTKQAILFAKAMGCKNIVFGCPRNRDTDDVGRSLPVAIDFFKELGDYALDNGTVLALEANPSIYNTRFMNTTEQAVEMVYKSSSEGIKVNVDLGTIIYNDEDIQYLRQVAEYINHVHISEPGLGLIERRELHNQLFLLLNDIHYQSFVSVEMGNRGDMEQVNQVIEYVKSLDV